MLNIPNRSIKEHNSIKAKDSQGSQRSNYDKRKWILHVAKNQSNLNLHQVTKSVIIDAAKSPDRNTCNYSKDEGGLEARFMTEASSRLV